MVPSTSSPAPVPLTSLPAGAVVTLHDVTDDSSRPVLRALGLTDASTLRLCQVGDPCIVQVRSTRIGLSSAVARCLLVVPTTTSR